MARKYLKSPLIEAVCDFKFSSSQPWDWTIPGIFYEHVRGDYPIKEQLSTIETKIDQSQGQFIQQSVPKLQLFNKKRNGVIQIAPDVLSIHQLQPYDGWIQFKQRIIDHLHIYQKVANPPSLTNIALRYINRIEISMSDIELEDYFQVLPKIPAPIPQIFPSFLLNVDIPYEKPLGILRITFGTVMPEASGELAYILDLNMYSVSNAVPTSDDQIIQWLEVAHEHVENAFEASFTSNAHSEIFGEVNA